MEGIRPPEIRLREMLCGYWISQAIHVAAELGIADRLAAGSLTAAQLADQLSADGGAHAPSLYRLLRALASVGLFREDEQNRFELTEIGQHLRDDLPQSLRPVARMIGAEHYRSWGELLHSVRTGQCAFEHVYGRNIFDHLSTRPREAAIFDRAMTGIHGRETAAMLAAYDFSDVQTLIDVGGGNGTVLVEALRQHSHLRGVLFDLPGTIARAQDRLADGRLTDGGVAARLSTVEGDFFQAVPSGGDAYLLRHIIHDWDDDRSRRILSACRRAMLPSARLLVIECVIPPGNDPDWGKFLDLNMLVVLGGQERTADDYRTLFTATGFELTRIVDTASDVSIVEGRPIG